MPIAVLSGPLANKHGNGGIAWVCLNWMLGLMRLGFQVYFVEQIRHRTCVDDSDEITTFDQSENLRYFRDVTSRFGVSHTAALLYEDGERIHGVARDELLSAAAEAAVLINISGHLRWPALFNRIRRKVYVDLDPGFTQLWQAAGNSAANLDGHDAFFTVGANIGSPDCSIPDVNIRWRPLRPPVVLSQWPACPVQDFGRFTTVASWRGPFGPIERAGTTLGLKVHEFRKFVTLPQRVPATFEIALNIHPHDERDRQLLLQHGWQLVRPATTGRPESFQQYVQTSDAEFSAAQGIYVQTNSGWFSDRTACYLASGKPALVQDTGFSRNYPVGAGLVAFSTLEEAVRGAESILSDYPRHCQAARAVAEEYFDSDKVLGGLLEQAGM